MLALIKEKCCDILTSKAAQQIHIFHTRVYSSWVASLKISGVQYVVLWILNSVLVDT